MWIQLDANSGWPDFRRHARRLLAQQVPPAAVHWSCDATAGLLFEPEPADALPLSPAGSATLPATSPVPLTVPAAFVRLGEQVSLHADPGRFDLLYRLLWRLAHEPLLRHDALDADWLLVRQMARAVNRDMHKMKAFVRFRPVQDGLPTPLYVAWFEPSHRIVEALAPWFVKRFTTMRWALLTPWRSLRWEPAACGPAADDPPGHLHIGPGGRREDAPGADSGEALWLTYYQHIFNPARLKLAAMQKEMPRKYWHNLPEAALIAPLAAQAHARSLAMTDALPEALKRRLPRQRPAVVAAATDATTTTVPLQPLRSLEALRAATLRCRECPIGEHATQSVIGEGPVGARLMLVGEQPGDQEDLQGHPFVGPAGQLLDRALAAADIARSAVFVSNAVKHFRYELRGKRRIHKSPTQHEAAACLHWLEDEIALVQPQALVALGATAARSLMGYAVGVTALRGQWLQRADGRPVLITWHPSALLRMPPAEREGAFAGWVADLKTAHRGAV